MIEARISRFAAWAVLVISGLVLIGWMLDIGLLKSIHPDWTGMRMVSAVCLALCASVLMILSLDEQTRMRRILISIAAAIVGMAGTATIAIILSELLLGYEPSIARWPLLRVFLARAERMSMLTAFSYMSISAALLFLAVKSRRAAGIAHALVLPIALLCYFTLVMYAFDFTMLSRWMRASMAFNAAVSILLLCMSFFSINTDSWLLRVLTSKEAGGMMARRLLPVVFILPLAGGGLRHFGESAGFFPSPVGIVLVIISTTIILYWIVWFTARAANRIDLARQSVERALRESEERLTLAFRAAQEGVWDWNLATGEVYYSPRWKQMLGYDEDEIEPQISAWERFLHPDDEEKVSRMMESSLSGRQGPLTFRLKHKDGHYIDILSQCIAVRREPEGPAVRLVGTHLDITARKKADDALRQLNEILEQRVGQRTAELQTANRILEKEVKERKRAEMLVKAERQQFYDLLEALPVYIVLIDSEYHVSFANRMFRERFGEVECAPCFGQIFGRNRPCEECDMLLSGKPGEIRQIEWTAQDGRAYDTSIQTMVNSEGKLYSMQMGIDVTERNKSVNELRQSENSLKEAQRLAHIGNWNFDLAKDSLTWSDEIYNIFGIDRAKFEASYDAFLDAVHPEDREAVDRAYRESVEMHSPYSISHRLLMKDGEVKHVHEQCETVYAPDGTPLRSHGTVQDITERVEAEQEIYKLNAELEQRVLERTGELVAANQELESFAYSVSHDLRAPLRGIEGWSQALIEDYGASLPKEASEYLCTIRAETSKMAEIIDAMLQLSRTTQKELVRQNVDLSSIAIEIDRDLRLRYPERYVEFRVEPSMTISADNSLMYVLLRNLIENSWRYTSKKERGMIEFYKEISDAKPVYYLKDNGAGFDPRFSHKLFQPFHRLHSQAEYPGTGIGLATVRRIINRHGGSIRAEGEPGKGACFYFTL